MTVSTVDAALFSLAEDVRQVVAASPGRTLRIRCNQAARKLGLTQRRVIAYWYGGVNLGAVKHSEAERIRARVAQWREAQADRAAAEAQLDRARRRLRADLGSLLDEGDRGAATRTARRKAARPAS